MTSGVSFQGLSTGLPTDQLISAILSQESQPMLRMETQQARNNQKTAALTTLKTDLSSLNIAMSTLQNSGFQARTVTSSDSNNTYVTATASGAAPGVYDLSVDHLATRSRLTLPASGNLNSAAAVGTGIYTLTDTDGKVAHITIDSTNNTMLGLRDAINSYKDPTTGATLNVNATVVQTNSAGGSQLILSATNTGVGKASSHFSISTDAATSALGLGSTATNGSDATDAGFTLNGVAMTRSSNSVSDAVDGVTFNLKSADSTGKAVTTLTVGLDKGAITSAMQAVVTKFNTLYQDYKKGTTTTTDSDGNITKGVFTNDSATRGFIQQVHDSLMGAPTGLSASASFNGAASVGLKTNRDGTLSLDTTAFQAALDKDPTGVTNVFNNTGTSSSPLLNFLGATSATTTSPISFSIGQPDPITKMVTATFTTPPPAGSSVPVITTVTSDTGYFYGASGSPIEGLTVKASAGANGTLNVSKGVSQNLQDLIQKLTSSSSGNIGNILQNITTQNYNLTNQISSQQERLDRRKVQLQNLYANLESTIGQLQAAGQSISSM